MNEYAAHFRSVLDEFPESIKYLQKIHKNICQKGRLPASILLEKQCSGIPVALTRLFGVAGVKQSLSGEVRVVPMRICDNFSQDQRTRWIEAIHDVCAVTYAHRGAVAREEEMACELLLQRLRLLFPTLTVLFPALATVLQSTPALRKAAVRGDLFDQWKRCAEAVMFLCENTECVTVSDLGARFFGNSKVLRSGALIATIADWIIALDSQGHLLPWQETADRAHGLRKEALLNHGVIESRCGINVLLFGSFLYEKNGERCDWVELRWKASEPAVLTLENIDGIANCMIPDNVPIITCENESPFVNLVQERIGAILIYTRGFPNAAVKRLYRVLAEMYPLTPRYHWGDTDLAGLRIAAILHEIAPLTLWRCDIETLHNHRQSLIELTCEQKESAIRFIEKTETFPFRAELVFTIANGWLEQEQYKGS